jgi:diguanylate cyclase (GGDEF)-like protein
VRPDDGTLIILDSGTGIRELGATLLRSDVQISRLNLLIGHTHWDHIQGFPFFTPAFLPKFELNIYAPPGFQRSVQDSLSGQMQYSYFPVKLQDLSSRIHFIEVEEGFFRLGDVLVETQYLNHTAPTLGFKITNGGATLAYVTDHEPFWTTAGFKHPGEQRHIEFLKGVDLVIHDAQYSEEEYESKRGWGHSTVDYATNVAIAAQAKRLALYHHDPTHDDAWVKQAETHARRLVTEAKSPVTVFAAAEGLEIELRNETTAQVVFPPTSALTHQPIAGERVLLVTGDPEEAQSIERVLAEESLIVDPCPTGARAVEAAAEVAPDLAIIRAELPDGAGESYIDAVRARAGKPELPVLILSEDASGSPGEATATDYITTPFSPPMLRTRVRVWLTRTISTAATAGAGKQPQARVVPARASRSEGLNCDEILAQVELFSHLTPAQLTRLLARATQRVFYAGQPIVVQGNPGHAAYIVLDGRVRVMEVSQDNSVETYMGELGRGQIFGELGILQNRPGSATIVSVERTVCLVLPEDALIHALKESPGMALALVRLLAGRLYDADRLLARLGSDRLTGLPARRAFHDLYARLASGVKRRKTGVALLSIDVVGLKQINDVHGYDSGDGVLRTVADVLMECSRVTDLTARHGGDEFAAVLMDATEGHANQVVARMLERFEAEITRRSLPDVELRVGLAVSPTPPDSVDELLRAADASSRVYPQTAPDAGSEN